jgi:hypothetical protein
MNSGDSGASFVYERDVTGAGYARISTTISCVLTRFRVKSVWSMLHFYRNFRRIQRRAAEVDGFLKAVFLVEGFWTCYTLSFWARDSAIGTFNTQILEHVAAANSAFPRTWDPRRKRAEIWSAQFQLVGVSGSNLAWRDLDLSALLAGEWWRVEMLERFRESET